MRPRRTSPCPAPLAVLLAASLAAGAARAQATAGAKAADKAPASTAVVVTGRGTTADEALRDGLRQAVGRVMGELVDAETLTKDDELITHKVLTYSKGFVSEYHELKEWREDDVTHKRLLVKVQRKELAITLGKHGLNPRPFDGRKLYARIVTGLQEEKEAREVLHRLFEKYPACVLSVALEADPEPKEKGERQVTLAYDLAVKVDPVKYRAFAKKAAAILDLVALKKGSCTLRGKTAPKALYEPFCTYFFPADCLPSARALKRYPTPMRLDFREYRENWWTSGFDPEAQMVILLYTGGDRGGFETEWAWYHVPAADLAHGRLDVRVCFRGPARRALKEDRLTLGPFLPGYNLVSRTFVHPKTREAAEGTQLVISPFFVLGPYYTTRAVLDRTVTMSLDDLREVRGIQCEAGPGERPAEPARPAARPPSLPPPGPEPLPPLVNPIRDKR